MFGNSGLASGYAWCRILGNAAKNAQSHHGRLFYYPSVTLVLERYPADVQSRGILQASAIAQNAVRWLRAEWQTFVRLDEWYSR